MLSLNLGLHGLSFPYFLFLFCVIPKLALVPLAPDPVFLSKTYTQYTILANPL